MDNGIKAEAVEIIKKFNTPDGKPYLRAVQVPLFDGFVIGWGCCRLFDPVTGDERPVKGSDAIDEDQAITLLNWSIVEVAKWIDENLWQPLNDDQFSAVVSFYTSPSKNNFFGLITAVNDDPSNLEVIGKIMRESVFLDKEGTRCERTESRREREFALYSGKYHCLTAGKKKGRE